MLEHLQDTSTDFGAAKRSYILALFSIIKIYLKKRRENSKNGIPQVEEFSSHGTSLELQILLELKAISGHCDRYSVGDGGNRVECMPSAMRQPRHFDSALSIATSMQNEPL